MLKRILIAFSMFLVTVTGWPSTFVFESSGWKLLFEVINEDEKACCIRGVSQKPDSIIDLAIPEIVTDYDASNYRVVEISEKAFSNCPLASVIIPNSVTRIGDYAFSNCSALTIINLPNSITEIGSGAFYNCSALIAINIPNSITRIENNTFEGCIALQSVDIPNSVTRIGYYAFSRCSELTAINLPNSVTEIGNNAFCGCWALETMNLPNSITRIENGTFDRCFALKSVNIPNSVTYIGKEAFRKCIDLNSIIIPSYVTTIGTNAFEDNIKLKKAAIPSDLESPFEEKDPFYGEENVTLIQYDRQNARIEDGFIYSRNKKEIYFAPISLPESYIMSDNVSVVGPHAFAHCENLHNLVLSSSLTTIGERAWYNCPNIETIYNPAREPIEAPTDIFMATVFDNATLFVHDECTAAYGNVEPWCYFYNINEGEYDHIHEIYDKNNDMRLDLSEPYMVYNINGTFIGHSLTNLSCGVYIIKQDDKTQKFIVK